MLTINATEARKEWSTVIDSVVRERPQFIKRTRDFMMLSDIGTIDAILSAYSFTADALHEKDGTVTLSLREMDLVENGENESAAKLLLAKHIMEYAENFYSEYEYWSKAPNRRAHIPYVFKALIIGDTAQLGEQIICLHGES